MSFYTSLSGLKGAQTDLSVISNNLANVGSTGFKQSRAQFGDLFASAPTQTTKMIAGQGTRLNGVIQQFTQGTLEATRQDARSCHCWRRLFRRPRRSAARTRSPIRAMARFRSMPTARWSIPPARRSSCCRSMPVAMSPATRLADAFDFVLPANAPGNPAVALVNVSVGIDGLVTATYADGSDEILGKVAMASFTAQEGLRPVGDSHWQSTGDSGPPAIDAATNGPLGTIRSGALERANVDVTEELVALIAAQRNFQANAKAIETASNMTQAIVNIN